MTVEENAEVLRELRHNVCHVFMVEDLMYLKRGGRLDAASAIVGSVLSIKPILVIAPDGKLQVIDKKRGQKAARDPCAGPEGGDQRRDAQPDHRCAYRTRDAGGHFLWEQGCDYAVKVRTSRETCNRKTF